MWHTSPTVYVGLLLLLCPGVAPFQLRTPGVCSARQPTFLSEPPNLMCAADAGTSSAPLLTALGVPSANKGGTTLGIRPSPL